jgi:chemotaxis protein histidine kinase CheA
MKKKLEAELISIAHRILKLKNRAELDQLQQETLNLYEKISVLRFVEDNFSDVKPTIGHASAEEALEEIYGLEEEPKVHANEVEAAEEKAKEEKAKHKSEEAEAAKADEAAKEEVKAEEPKAEEPKEEEKPEELTEEKAEEPVAKIEIEKPAEELKAMEEAVVAVFEKEEDSTPEEEEKAADAEVETIEPDANTKVEDSGLSFKLAFESETEEPAKQKEITFEDYKDYKEPEFIKKEDVNAPKKAETPKAEKPAAPEAEEAAAEPTVRDWRDWEPSKSEEPKKEESKAEEKAEDKSEETAEEPKPEDTKVEEPVKEEPKAEEPKAEARKEEPKQESTVRGNIASRTDFERPKSLNDSLGKSITLGLNDRIAFEKNLFGGSTDDLNRVLSQLNTINTFDEAKDFINELVKPDYNDWKGKEEYEERFLEIVEKKFN